MSVIGLTEQEQNSATVYAVRGAMFQQRDCVATFRRGIGAGDKISHTFPLVIAAALPI